MDASFEAMAEDPEATRRFIAETREYVERSFGELHERTFGVSEDALMSNPDLLDHFLHHSDPKLRGAALLDAAACFNDLAVRPRHFVDDCKRLARSEPDRELRRSAFVALGFLYTATHETSLLADLARPILDPDEDAAIRKEAYLSFVLAFDLDESIPGAVDASFRFAEARTHGVTNYECKFVRSVLCHLGVEGP